MSSAVRSFSQMPAKSNWVVKTSHFIETGPDANQTKNYGDVYTSADFDTWYAANVVNVAKLGKGMYVVNDSANFNTVMRNQFDHDTYGSNYLDRFNGRTLRDMGSEISIGNSTDPRLLVFRLVKLPSTAANAGGNGFGYVVVENNLTIGDLSLPRFTIGVCRA
jgi:hypothetical protein